MIGTYILLAIIRIVGRYTEILTRDAIRIGTYSKKSTDKNKVSVELATLDIRNSARYKEILLSGRKH
jgi:hypothetical protein